jgi:hypothetical protein
MTNLLQRKSILILIMLALMVSVCSPILLAQQEDEALKKKYAPVLGTYEFSLDAQVMVITFWVEGGAILGAPEGETPAEIIPVEGQELKFEADVEGQNYELTFVKDESGKVTSCIMAVNGMEVAGIKIEK